MYGRQDLRTNLYPLILYCLEKHVCRRVLLSTFFHETFDAKDCNAQCDICKLKLQNDVLPEQIDVSSDVILMSQIMQEAADDDSKLTMRQCVDKWKKERKRHSTEHSSSSSNRSTNASSLLLPLTADDGDWIILRCIFERVFKEVFAHTAYSTISYVFFESSMIDKIRNGKVCIKLCLPSQSISTKDDLEVAETTQQSTPKKRRRIGK
jgi:hypothetical protein